MQDINALEQHIKNLLSPSTPYIFNTLYDPYREGADFVRGYPFSLREGVPTAISHGLWLNIPDYDAPTQVTASCQRSAVGMAAVATASCVQAIPQSIRAQVQPVELSSMTCNCNHSGQAVDDLG